jgi:hypothetical protein
MRLTKLAAIAAVSLYAVSNIAFAVASTQTVTDASMITLASKKGGGKAKEGGGKSCGEFKYFDAKKKKCSDARDKK